MSFKSCPEGPTELNGHMHVDQIQTEDSEQRVRDCLEFLLLVQSGLSASELGVQSYLGTEKGFSLDSKVK